MFNLGGIPRSSKPGDPNAEIQTELSTTSTATSPNVWEQLIGIVVLLGWVLLVFWKNKGGGEENYYKPVKI